MLAPLRCSGQHPIGVCPSSFLRFSFRLVERVPGTEEKTNPGMLPRGMGTSGREMQRYESLPRLLCFWKAVDTLEFLDPC